MGCGIYGIRRPLSTIFESDAGGTGRWILLQDPDTWTPYHFGAKGDGVKDDTAAMQRAVDFCAGAHELYIDSGQFLLEDSIVTLSSQPLILKGSEAGVFVAGNGLSGKPLFDFEVGSTGHYLSGLIFNGNNNAANAIKIINVTDFVLYECTFINLQSTGAAILGGRVKDISINDNNFLAGDYTAIDITFNNTVMQPGDRAGETITVFENMIKANGGIKIDGYADIRDNYIDIEVVGDGALMLGEDAVHNFIGSISNNNFHLKKLGSNPVVGITGIGFAGTISANEFMGVGISDPNSFAIDIDRGQDASKRSFITSNHIEGFQTGIRVTNITNGITGPGFAGRNIILSNDFKDVATPFVEPKANIVLDAAANANGVHASNFYDNGEHFSVEGGFKTGSVNYSGAAVLPTINLNKGNHIALNYVVGTAPATINNIEGMRQGMRFTMRAQNGGIVGLDNATFNLLAGKDYVMKADETLEFICVSDSRVEEVSSSMGSGSTLAAVEVADTGNTISLATPLGTYCNMSSPNNEVSYTVTNPSMGGWAMVLINSLTEPTVTNGTKLSGPTFQPATNMYLVVYEDGSGIKYYFLKV